MDAWEFLENDEADFAVTVTDDALSPYVPAGESVLLRRRVDLRDGDVGLFYTRSGLAFRQFCQDSRGTVYLFAVNRRRRREDRSFTPAEAARVICYGKVLLPRPIPLPED